MLLLICTLHTEAQDATPSNVLSLQWGTGFIQRQDLVFSPFIHRDWSLANARLEYRREGKFLQRAAIDFAGFSPMVSDPFQFYINGEALPADPHIFSFIGLEYALAMRLQGTDKLGIALGGIVNSDVQVANYVYGRFGSFGYTALFNVGAFADATYTLSEKHSLGGTLILPFLSWVARSPYLVNDDAFITNTSADQGGVRTFFNLVGDGNLATWSEMFQLSFELRYLYHLNERWDLGAVAEHRHIQVDFPRKLQSFQHHLRISANYKF